MNYSQCLTRRSYQSINYTEIIKLMCLWYSGLWYLSLIACAKIVIKKNRKERNKWNRMEYISKHNTCYISKLGEISHKIKDIDFYLFCSSKPVFRWRAGGWVRFPCTSASNKINDLARRFAWNKYSLFSSMRDCDKIVIISFRVRDSLVAVEERRQLLTSLF